jgi:hypothetical protein
MDMTIIPDPGIITYLNVVAQDPGNSTPEAWIIQNMPILPASAGEDSQQDVDFDFQDLGDSPGVLVSSLLVRYSVTSSPLSSPPAGTMSLSMVSTLERRTLGVKDGDLFPRIDRPAGQKAAGAPTNVIQHKNVPAVQEAVGACLAGSMARSIKWLLNGEALYPNKSAQDIYKDLFGLGLHQGSATTYTNDILAKAKYLNGLVAPLGFVGVTSLNLVKAGRVGATPGVTQETTDLVDWLKRELPNHDVELDLGSHIVTITGMYQQGGMTYVKYRDDEKQGDDTKGDTAEKRAKLTKDGADYVFRQVGLGTDDFKVKMGVSETIDLPPPPNVATLSPHKKNSSNVARPAASSTSLR